MGADSLCIALLRVWLKNHTDERAMLSHSEIYALQVQTGT